LRLTRPKGTSIVQRCIVCSLWAFPMSTGSMSERFGTMVGVSASRIVWACFLPTSLQFRRNSARGGRRSSAGRGSADARTRKSGERPKRGEYQGSSRPSTAVEAGHGHPRLRNGDSRHFRRDQRRPVVGADIRGRAGPVDVEAEYARTFGWNAKRSSWVRFGAPPRQQPPDIQSPLGKRGERSQQVCAEGNTKKTTSAYLSRDSFGFDGEQSKSGERNRAERIGMNSQDRNACMHRSMRVGTG
jgi:hypothetical protein